MALIGIMDSGSGGLSVLKEMLKALPSERYSYFSDNAFCPYGDKTRDFIIGRCRRITQDFISSGAEAVVVACNTATAAAIETLRREFSIPFVGMEPAVKSAALGTQTGVIGVLATAGTLKASRYLRTRGRFEDEVRIVEHVGSGFVELVESLDLDSAHTREVVRASLVPLLEEGADRIVLGCTHYPFLREVMEEVISEWQESCPQVSGREIRLIDPAPAVARQLVKVLQDNGIPAQDQEPGVEFRASGPDAALRALAGTL